MSYNIEKNIHQLVNLLAAAIFQIHPHLFLTLLLLIIPHILLIILPLQSSMNTKREEFQQVLIMHKKL
jgi:hypothetical protein